MIRLDGICCERDGRPLLDEATLAVNAAELVVVAGGRGAGKSLLAAVAAARRAPDRGRVLVADRDVTGLQRSSLPFVRRNIAYLPASPSPTLLDDETAMENIMLALAVRGERVASAEAAARRMLALLSVDDRAERIVATLSAGERQLVAIARALAGAPPVIVLDEPVASLGREDRAAVLGALVAARETGAAILCATADESWAETLTTHGARRLKLDAGRIVGGAPAIALVPRVIGVAPGRPTPDPRPKTPAPERVRGGS